MKSTLMSALVVSSVCILAGCKETYENPEKFLDKYVVQDCVNTIWTQQMLSERKLKGPFVSGIHLEQRSTLVGPLTAVCATLRFEPVSKDTIYIQEPLFPNQPYSISHVVRGKDIGDILEATISVLRAKMDDGVYAPVDHVGRNDIQGWGLVGALSVLDPAKCEAGLAELLKKAAPENVAVFVRYAACYAQNGQLDYINDQENLQRLADFLVGIKDASGKNPQVMRALPKGGLADIEKVLELLRAKGVAERSLDKVKADANLTAFAARGRVLFSALASADAERAAQGLDSIWPKIGKAISSDEDDIGGKAFANSAEYFNEVLDRENGGEAPYIAGVGLDVVFDAGQPLWSLVMDDGTLSGKTAKTPVLISSNFDCANLRAKWDGKSADADKVIPCGTCPKIGGSGIVVIHKDGAVTVLTADKVTLRNIYGSSPVDGAGCYLTSKGIVKLDK